MTLALPADKRPLMTQKDRLAATLADYFGRKIKLEVQLADDAGDSLAARDAQRRDERQSAAVAAFMADPAVQVLLRDGDGQVQPGSIHSSE